MADINAPKWAIDALTPAMKMNGWDINEKGLFRSRPSSGRIALITKREEIIYNVHYYEEPSKVWEVAFETIRLQQAVVRAETILRTGIYK